MTQQADRKFMILLMGVTGAGKTTFASHASGQGDLGIGHGLDPCTQDPLAIHFNLDGHRIVLIDTPGFDDDQRNDIEILSDVANWLSHQSLLSKNQPLDGLILLHPVTRDGVSGMERRRTQLLETILGKDAYKRVTIATTMWSSVKPDRATRLEAEYFGSLDKRRGRLSEMGIWHNFRREGARVVKHENHPKSAHDIIRNIIERSKEEGKLPETLLQKEMDSNLGLMGSSLGKQLVEHLEEDIRDLEADLLEHCRNEKPVSRGSRWSLGPVKESPRKWLEWELERQALERRIQRRQMQLKKLQSLMVSTCSFPAYALCTVS